MNLLENRVFTDVIKDEDGIMLDLVVQSKSNENVFISERDTERQRIRQFEDGGRNLSNASINPVIITIVSNHKNLGEINWMVFPTSF